MTSLSKTDMIAFFVEGLWSQGVLKSMQIKRKISKLKSMFMNDIFKNDNIDNDH